MILLTFQDNMSGRKVTWRLLHQLDGIRVAWTRLGAVGQVRNEWILVITLREPQQDFLVGWMWHVRHREIKADSRCLV